MKREKQDWRVYLSGLESSCRQPGETSAEAGVAVSIDVLDEGRYETEHHVYANVNLVWSTIK